MRVRGGERGRTERGEAGEGAGKGALLAGEGGSHLEFRSKPFSFLKIAQSSPSGAGSRDQGRHACPFMVRKIQIPVRRLGRSLQFHVKPSPGVWGGTGWVGDVTWWGFLAWEPHPL